MRRTANQLTIFEWKSFTEKEEKNITSWVKTTTSWTTDGINGINGVYVCVQITEKVPKPK